MQFLTAQKKEERCCLADFLSDTFTVEAAVQLQRALFQELILPSIGGFSFEVLTFPAWLTPAACSFVIDELSVHVESESSDALKTFQGFASSVFRDTMILSACVEVKAATDGSHSGADCRTFSKVVALQPKASTQLKLLLRTHVGLKAAYEYLVTVSHKAVCLLQEKAKVIQFCECCEKVGMLFSNADCNFGSLRDQPEFQQLKQSSAVLHDFPSELTEEKTRMDTAVEVLTRFIDSTESVELAELKDAVANFCKLEAGQALILPSFAHSTKISKISFALSLFHALADEAHRPILAKLSQGLEAITRCPQSANLKAMVTLLADLRQTLSLSSNVPDCINPTDTWLQLLVTLQALTAFLTERVVPNAQKSVVKDIISSQKVVELDVDESHIQHLADIFVCSKVATSVQNLAAPPLPDFDAEALLKDRSGLEKWFVVLSPILQHHDLVTEELFGDLAATYHNIVEDYGKVLGFFAESVLGARAELLALSSSSSTLLASVEKWDFSEFASIFADEANLTAATESLQKAIDVLNENIPTVSKILSAGAAFPKFLQEKLEELKNADKSLKAVERTCFEAMFHLVCYGPMVGKVSKICLCLTV